MIGSKSWKNSFEKKPGLPWDVPVWTLLMSHDKHGCPGTSLQGRPGVFSRSFSTFGTNHEYGSSCLYGLKYQSSKLLSLRIFISYFFFDNFLLFHLCPTSAIVDALKTGTSLGRTRIKSHKRRFVKTRDVPKTSQLSERQKFSK